MTETPGEDRLTELGRNLASSLLNEPPTPSARVAAPATVPAAGPLDSELRRRSRSIRRAMETSGSLVQPETERGPYDSLPWLADDATEPTVDDATDVSAIREHVAPTPAEPEEEPQPASVGRTLVEWVLVLVAAVVLAVVVQRYVVQIYGIPSESMYPTLKDDDRVAVSKISYRIGGGVERGDVVVFKRPAELVSSDPDQPEQLVKRVVGLAGETVEVRDGEVFVDGEPLDEDGYLRASDVTENLNRPVTVGTGQVFVMGDNRLHSYDSRYFGTIPESDIIGRAVAVAWPLDRWGTL